jgi:CRISPR-associated endonuclease/helicase Cas3
MIYDARQLFDDLRRVEVYDKTKVGGWTNDEIEVLVEQQVEKFGSVLVVVNTKKTAREIYHQCNQIANVKTYHLTTHMCPAHRMELLNQIKARLNDKKPVICVSTQLIEAGVDISFGSVIRFLAGLDSIAQAAGRCNRHNEQYPVRGEVYIINPADENINMLEEIKIGKEKTERILSEFNDNPGRFKNDRISPEAMGQYYQYYFYQRSKEMDYPVGCKSAIGREDNLFNLLSLNTLSVSEYQRMNNNKNPEISLKQAFMSAAKSFEAIATVARGIVVPYGREGKTLINKLCSTLEIDKQYRLLHHAQRYSVNVFPNVLEKLQKLGAIHEEQEGSGILYLDEQYYSDEFGLSEVPVKDMEILDA